MEHVVLALFGDGWYEVQLGSDVECLLDLARAPFLQMDEPLALAKLSIHLQRYPSNRPSPDQ